MAAVQTLLTQRPLSWKSTSCSTRSGTKSSTARFTRWQPLFFHDYHQIGVREVWAVDLQNEEIEVLAWEEWGYRTVGWFRGETPLTSQVLPGLQIVPQALFAQGAAASQTE
jgi:hypothetical protein